MISKIEDIKPGEVYRYNSPVGEGYTYAMFRYSGDLDDPIIDISELRILPRISLNPGDEFTVIETKLCSDILVQSDSTTIVDLCVHIINETSGSIGWIRAWKFRPTYENRLKFWEKIL